MGLFENNVKTASKVQFYDETYPFSKQKPDLVYVDFRLAVRRVDW